MPDDLYIGVDLGTTGVKVGLFDADGRTVATAAREIELDAPAPGFLEFDADAYVGLAFDAIREVLAADRACAGAVKAVGLSSQAQTFVLLDAAGRPLRPAVSWLDVRAAAEAEELSAQARRLGRGELNAIASGPKILWLRRHEPETAARVARMQAIPDYFLFRLTGRAATDPVTASATGLYDRWNPGWIDELLDACGLSRAMVPDVLRPGEPAGTLTEDAARELGLAPDAIGVVGTNDQYAGALGAGNIAPGCASLALGTALAIVATSTTRENVPRGEGVAVHPAAEVGRELYALLAYAKTSGVLFRWFRDQFAPGLSYDELFAEIGAAPVGSGGVSCIPHFSGTGTPDFDPAVRGAFSGITLSHGRAHLARALAESLAFTVRDNLELLGRTVDVTELRAIGGGARSDVWLQMIADVAGVTVERPRAREAACLGAAALAMVGAGRFATVAEAAARLYKRERRFAPDAELRERYDEARRRHRALFESMYGAKEDAPDG